MQLCLLILCLLIRIFFFSCQCPRSDNVLPRYFTFFLNLTILLTSKSLPLLRHFNPTQYSLYSSSSLPSSLTTLPNHPPHQLFPQNCLSPLLLHNHLHLPKRHPRSSYKPNLRHLKPVLRFHRLPSTVRFIRRTYLPNKFTWCA